MNLEDLNNLDFNNMGSWPLAAKIGVIIIAFLTILGAGYWFDTQYRLEEWDNFEKQEKEKIKIFEDKQKNAASLDKLKEQMISLEESFKIMLKQLPNKAEVDALLVDISQTGLGAGLEFELFKPDSEVIQDFRNLPIQIVVTGNYHQCGKFISNVAALPRIVTLHDISLKIAGSKDIGKEKITNLRMEAVAKIYHYPSDEAKK